MRFPKPYADAVQRLRVPGGFLLLGAFLLLARPTWDSMWLGMPVSLAGLLIRVWAAGHLEKNERLVESGPYGYVRNPLYVGSLFVAAGVVISSRSWALAAVFLGTFLLIYLPVIQQEEDHLRQLFAAYDRYAQRVPSLLPRFPPAGSSEPFRWLLYRRNREWRAAAGYLFALGVLAAKCYWSGE